MEPNMTVWDVVQRIKNAKIDSLISICGITVAAVGVIAVAYGVMQVVMIPFEKTPMDQLNQDTQADIDRVQYCLDHPGTCKP